MGADVKHGPTTGYYPSIMTGAPGPERTVTLPNGLIIKMGYKTRSGNDTTLTFGTAFPTDIVTVIAIPYNPAGGVPFVVIKANSRTTVTIYCVEAIAGFNWIAIGY